MAETEADSINASMEFYRSSAAGIALTKALNTMLESNEITMEAALLILDEFDKEFQELLRDNLLLKKNLSSMDVIVRLVFSLYFCSCCTDYYHLCNL